MLFLGTIIVNFLLIFQVHQFHQNFSCKKIVMACAVLHNIAIENKLPIDECAIFPPEVPEQEHRGNVQGGNARRSFIVDNFF